MEKSLKLISPSFKNILKVFEKEFILGPVAQLDSQEIFMKNARVKFECIFPMSINVAEVMVVQDPKNELTPHETVISETGEKSLNYKACNSSTCSVRLIVNLTS